MFAGFVDTICGRIRRAASVVYGAIYRHQRENFVDRLVVGPPSIPRLTTYSLSINSEIINLSQNEKRRHTGNFVLGVKDAK